MTNENRNSDGTRDSALSNMTVLNESIPDSYEFREGDEILGSDGWHPVVPDLVGKLIPDGARIRREFQF